MINKDKLVDQLAKFMELKTQRIKEIFEQEGLNPELLEDYWRPEDRKLLEELPLPNLVKAKGMLIMAFRFEEEGTLVGYKACPFCLAVDKNCKVCPYGKAKGECLEPGSVYYEAIMKPGEGISLPSRIKIGELLKRSKHEDLIEKSGLKEAST